MPLHVSSACAHHQEVKIALHSLGCYDTRGCVMQFWPPDDEHMCSKHVEAWNKVIVKQKFCASSCLITEINILRCTVSKTSKHKHMFRSLMTIIRELYLHLTKVIFMLKTLGKITSLYKLCDVAAWRRVACVLRAVHTIHMLLYDTLPHHLIYITT